MKERTRIAYLSGPVDATEVYNAWIRKDHLAYFGDSHMSSFFQLCSDLGSEGYVITTLDRGYSRERLGPFVIENRPMPTDLSGLRYHVALLFWILRMTPSLIHFRPHFLLLTAGLNYWFIFSILRLQNTVIIPVLTCNLWPQFAPTRPAWRALLWLNKLFFWRRVKTVVAASESIAKQVRLVVGTTTGTSVIIFLPKYPREQFARMRVPDFDKRPFTVLFAGRIEESKGVYHLVEMADQLQREASGRFHFNICGDGPRLAALRNEIINRQLSGTITCHGFCDRKTLTEQYQSSHIVLVPTTTASEEGFNMVCAEAILAGRPLVTSRVCPALTYVRDAAIEVPPDDVLSYSAAILRFSNDRALYETKRLACDKLQSQFYETENSWGAKVREAIRQRSN